MKDGLELSNVLNHVPGEVEKNLMSQIENVLHEKIIHSIRSDESKKVVIGTCATALTELLAALNKFYNQASQQLAAFQTYLDRINRSSICYSMISEEEFEKKTQQQQDVIKKIVEALLEEKKK